MQTHLTRFEPHTEQQVARNAQPTDPAGAALATVVDRALLWLPAADAEPLSMGDRILSDVLARTERQRAAVGVAV